jgi:metallo-beta-lactamase family protein
MLHDPRHDVLFIGYQAQGTPGRAIQMYGERGGYVDFDHERYKIGAEINTTGGCSTHADQQGLFGFVIAKPSADCAWLTQRKARIR